jgi:hypothetical protein
LRFCNLAAWLGRSEVSCKQSSADMFAFVDETGNTGENLFDEEQPLFITAALITKTDFDIFIRHGWRSLLAS